MRENEQRFIDYYFTYIIGKQVSADKINEAHFILRGVKPSDDCNQCIKTRKQKLDNTYISITKIGQPKLIVVKKKSKELINGPSSSVGSLETIKTKKIKKLNDIK